MEKSEINITFVSTWPECADGIATFCENLAFNLPHNFQSKKIIWNVIRVNWIKQIRGLYKSKIVYSFPYDKISYYERTAQFINKSDCDVVVIQFINGIYGDKGRFIFRLIDKLNKPILIILHSVAMLPSQSDLKLKQKILKQFSSRHLDVVTMSKTASIFLIDKIGFNKQNVHQIYHGAPLFPKISLINRNKIRKNLGFTAKDKVIFAYGILREDKGIIQIIEALKILNSGGLEVKLLLCGTEPNPDQSYTQQIIKLIEKNNLQKNIKFVNKFIPQSDIGKYLQMSDLYITAQTNLGLHSSGTLSYALSAGTVALSTPTVHAKELLKNKELIFDVNNSDMLAQKINNLFADINLYKKVKKDIISVGRKILWPNIAKQYLKVILSIYIGKKD